MRDIGEKADVREMDDPDELLQQGRWRDAMRAFEQRAGRTGDPSDLVDASAAAQEAGLLAEAEALASRAIQLDPNCEAAYVQLGLTFSSLERYDDAREMYERALQYEMRPSLLCLIGVVYRRLGEYAKAEAALKRAIEMEPTADEAHHNLGAVLQQARPNEAVEHYRRALELDPKREFSRREMGVALWNAGRVDEAIEAFELAAEFNGDDAWAHYFWGRLLWSKGKLEEAQYQFRRAVELEPSSGVMWARLGSVTAAAGDRPGAGAFFVRGLVHAPTDAVLCRDYGLWLVEEGKLEEGRSYLERAMDLDPGDGKAKEALRNLRHQEPEGGNDGLVDA